MTVNGFIKPERFSVLNAAKISNLPFLFDDVWNPLIPPPPWFWLCIHSPPPRYSWSSWIRPAHLHPVLISHLRPQDQTSSVFSVRITLQKRYFFAILFLLFNFCCPNQQRCFWLVDVNLFNHSSTLISSWFGCILNFWQTPDKRKNPKHEIIEIYYFLSLKAALSISFCSLSCLWFVFNSFPFCF